MGPLPIPQKGVEIDPKGVDFDSKPAIFAGFDLTPKGQVQPNRAFRSIWLENHPTRGDFQA